LPPEQRLALDQRQLPEIVTVEIEQVEGYCDRVAYDGAEAAFQEDGEDRKQALARSVSVSAAAQPPTKRKVSNTST
jgi:hypothetical protein